MADFFTLAPRYSADSDLIFFVVDHKMVDVDEVHEALSLCKFVLRNVSDNLLQSFAFFNLPFRIQYTFREINF